MAVQFNTQDSTPVVYGRSGTQTECELCGQLRRCFDYSGLVVCQDCRAEYLPGEWML